MKKNLLTLKLLLVAIILLSASLSFSAYHHMDEQDSDKFLEVYPNKANTKLDSCALCHSGGSYEKYPDSGKFITMGSCQWCHYKYGYDGSGNIVETLNPYGKDYYLNGRNEGAIRKIETLDSDKDGFSNINEIEALRNPGDASDDPEKIIAPFRIYSRQELSQLPSHTQFMLMNTSRSGDYYAQYTGVPLEVLLEDADILESATGITVYAPDGWSTYHPLEYVEEPSLYHVKGIYPQATYYHDPEAELWCDYSAPLCSSFSHGSIIPVTNGLKALIALQVNGTNLEQGVLNVENKLDGSGPYRIIVPQKTPGEPDQSSREENQNVVWPYNHDLDHNAGYCTRSVTIIKVEPLPEGTTDINVMEAGWNFIDQEKIIIYGAIKGQSGSITGQLFVIKNNERIGLSNAEIKIIETGHKTVSQSDGTYILEEVPIGEYNVSINYEDYKVVTFNHIIVEEDKETKIPICTLSSRPNVCDIDNDDTITLKEIIHWLKKLAGMSN